MPKIAFLHSEWNGCAHWRMFEPARFLNNVPGLEIVCFPKLKRLKGKLEWFQKKVKGCDLIVSMRCDNIHAVRMLAVLRHTMRVPLVFETDDNFDNVDTFNISHRHWTDGSAARISAGLQMDISDLYQFSTFPLKQAYGYKHRKPTWVMPNLIDIEEGRHRKKNDTDEIRIAWAGSATHYKDLEIIFPVLQDLVGTYPKLKVVLTGMKPDFVYANREKKILKRGFEIAISGEFDTWVKHLGSLKADIAIAPLENIRFNKDKSNCRYLEWSALKVPGVYAKMYPYEKTVHHGVDGFLAPSHVNVQRNMSRSDLDKWREYLVKLIESKDLREDMAGKAYENVLNNHSWQKNANIWADNYAQMLNENVDLSDIDRAEEELEGWDPESDDEHVEFFKHEPENDDIDLRNYPCLTQRAGLQ